MKSQVGERTFATRLSERIQSDRVVQIALFVCSLFVVLAIAAPLLASSRPFLLVVPEGAGGRGFGALPDGVSFPWFASLFDRLAYPEFGDRFFNGLLLLAPLLIASRFIGRPARVGVLLVATLVAMLLATFADTSRPASDYAGRIAAAESRGQRIDAWFPPIRFSSTDPDLDTGMSGPTARHPFGTDGIGRDVCARLLFGSRSALLVALLAVLFSYSFGAALGAIAGYRGGLADACIGRAIDVFACLPFLVIVMASIAVTGRHTTWNLIVICAVFGWDHPARLVRTEMLRLRELESTLAARALGLPEWRIISTHLVPAALTPLLAGAAFSIASLMLVETTLSFFGLTDPTVASWGQILRAGRDTRELHLILAPGILIFCVVTAVNLLADATRESIEPKAARE